MQMKHEKADVFRAIVSMEERSTLKRGDTVARPYRSAIAVQTYSRGTAFTVQDITDAEETLQVNISKIAPFYVDDLDALQHNYAVTNLYADDAAVQLGNWIDADVQAEVVNAYSKVGAFEVAGTGSASDGLGFTVSTTNIQKVFAIADRKLNEQNISPDRRFAVISPAFKQVLLEYLAGRESALGDSTGINGHIGKYFGFDLYVSNNVCYTYTLQMGTTPTDGDTVVINGVTFTFETGTIDAAGKVKAETSGAVSAGYLVSAINAPGTTSATFQALSAADQLLMHGISAVAVSTTGLKVISQRGAIVVSEVLTAAADIWTTGMQIQHQMFGQKGAIDVVIQKEPNVEFKEVQDKLGRNVAPWTLYGLKTFLEGTYKLVDVQTL
jgi:hypothetical protein